MRNLIYIWQLKRARNRLVKDYSWNIINGFSSLNTITSRGIEELTKLIESEENK